MSNPNFNPIPKLAIHPSFPHKYESIILHSYTPGQIEFIKWLQCNRNTLVVFDDCTIERANLIDTMYSTTNTNPWVAIPAWIAVAPARKAHRGAYYIPEIHLDVSTLVVNTNTRGRRAGSPNVKGRPVGGGE